MAWLTGYSYRKSITIQQAYVDSSLSDFPLYVYINNDSDMTTALATGYDVRFTQSDGETLLYYERESWTGGGGSNVTADFWVQVPTIAASPSDPTVIYIYWGKAGDSDGEDATNVWDANFAAVFHMGDLTDSTGNGYTLTNSGAVLAPAKIGNGYDFERSDPDYMYRTASVPVTVPPFTLEAVFRPESTGVRQVPVSIADKDATYYHALWIDITDDALRARTYGGTVADAIADTISAGNWYHAWGVWSATDSRKARLNWGTEGTDSTNQTVANVDNIKVGVSADSTPLGFCDGIIDEVRVHSTDRSDAWGKFTKYNLLEADNELTWGSVEESAGMVRPKVFASLGSRTPLLGALVR